jgi:hypothetical protein
MVHQELPDETYAVQLDGTIPPEDYRALAQHDMGELVTGLEVEDVQTQEEAERLAAEIEDEWAQPSRYYRG